MNFVDNPLDNLETRSIVNEVVDEIIRTGKQIMGRSKSKKRVKIVESIASAISSKKIFDVIDYRNRNEDYIKQYMHQPLINELEALYEDLELSKSADKELVKEKAKNCLLWEGDVNTTVNNFTFLELNIVLTLLLK